ncbi:5-amino-6-(5-phospho-D-ribitylamino)uracil phosphatase YigB [Vibrio mangrovi]|uniref:5-amino-6-(5-phospho-D-ribitylamino)uracil phosphatase YigB n=1 Tax=Vibrio mangrovi TaxID=474394 RepID=A0A1Y6IW61_9VIBR|nr:5-amino-6-(5-phospho-D-ribitylamino)uracil phosphatase YigB [Vibrio mangrovi]MDW6002579.1 5-amino-6-(5-phospho-D-ribitylamino)uracil phosphatase YigB [Vibrio mangrovi]SMS01889.1 Flavin mononucleotide phosphatase YigB [Vibrio mangrovi]
MYYYRFLPSIQAMTFDLDDTLYDNVPVIRRLENKMLDWMHLNHPISALRPDEWWKQLKASLAQSSPELVHDVTQWRYENVMQGLILLGYAAHDARNAAEDAINEMFYWRNQIDVPEETHQVLTLLSRKIPLVAITNGNVDPEKIGLGHYFQRILKAGPDGFSKPYPDLFVKAQRDLGLPSSHILHVGDHLRTDVYGAKMNGFGACWLNDRRKNMRTAHAAMLLPDLEIHQLQSLLHLL